MNAFRIPGLTLLFEITVATPLDEECLVSPAENMPKKLLPVVQADGVRAEEPPHPGHKVGVGRFQHQVEVVPHQAVSMHLPAGFLGTLRQRLEELLTINIIEKNVLSPVAPVQIGRA